jgi:hypothetical protein
MRSRGTGGILTGYIVVASYQGSFVLFWTVFRFLMVFVSLNRWIDGMVMLFHSDFRLCFIYS